MSTEIVRELVDGEWVTTVAAGGGGGGGVSEITSQDMTVTITDPTGPTVDLSAGGGSQPGADRTLRFDFDFTMAAALATGVTVWTPAADDLLLDAWLEYIHDWEGDGTPFFDMGLISTGAWVDTGLWNNIFGPIDMSTAGPPGGTGFVLPSGAPYSQAAAIPNLSLSGIGLAIGNQGTTVSATVPLRFLGTSPLKAVVSNDGTPSGGALLTPSAGQSILWIKVCSPTTTP